ncbi:CoA transferase [Mycobacterium syngnathidarum]
MTLAESDPPLSGVRILDLAAGDAARVTRTLADLGADVIKIEPPGGCSERHLRPLVRGRGVAQALHDANKRSVVLDPSEPDARRRFLALAGTADIVVDSGNPGGVAAFAGSAVGLADRFDHLVVMSVTDFGLTGPKAAWRATDAVLSAMSSVLSRSGPPGGTPVLPPRGIAAATAAAQATWAALVAYYQRLRTGRGDLIDFARYEGVLQALDPPFGAQGQAAAARGLTGARRGRPTRQDSYPIFECQDGWVRICILAPRQWRAMRAWLGEPARFQDAKYDTISARVADFDLIGAAIAELFAQHRAEELVEIGAARGVPVAALLTPAELLTVEHFQAVSAWTTTDLDEDTALTVPDGCVVVDGGRAGIRWLAPEAGSGAPEWWPAPRPEPDAADVERPFEGVRILDLGVIVAGGELGRLFADHGAEVIKIESPAHPDGLRQARPGQTMSESFAWARRNHLAVGLDLRTPAGAGVFATLVSDSDAVFANFKPGTLAALDFPYERLRALNPRVVLAESSAYGDSGPWSSLMGYGPLVRSATGVTRMWIDEDDDRATRHPFSDAVTVFPDHLVARLAATATLAALIRRRRTGAGTHIHISQAETAVSQLDTLYTTAWAVEALPSGVSEDLALDGVYPCRGDDEWCVVSIGSDAEWRALVDELGSGDLAGDPRFATARDRWAHRRDLHAAVAESTSAYVADDLAERLQRRGVAAAPMLRAADVLTEPQVHARGVYADMTHPLFDVPLPAEIGPAPYRHIPPPDLRPAPLLGEHTIDVCRRVLDMSREQIDGLLIDGVLFAAETDIATAGGRTA